MHINRGHDFFKSVILYMFITYNNDILNSILNFKTINMYFKMV